MMDTRKSMFNHYVLNHPLGDVLQTTHWGQLKAQFSGWEYSPLGLMDPDLGIRASVLLLRREVPYMKRSIFYSPRGPLFNDKEALVQLLKEVKEWIRKQKGIFWKMDPPLPYGHEAWKSLQGLLRVESGLDFESVQPRFIMELDLKPPLEDLLANMKKKTRYNIRYAQKKNVKVRIAEKKSELLRFYPLLVETAKRDGFRIRGLPYFEHLWDTVLENKLGYLFMAFHKEDLLAAAILFRTKHRAVYVYGASSSADRSLQPSYALQWAMIAWAKSVHCKVYDFRGISGDLNPNNPLYGLYRFKEGFGAKVVEYVGEYDAVTAPLLYPLWNSYQHCSRLWRQKGTSR